VAQIEDRATSHRDTRRSMLTARAGEPDLNPITHVQALEKAPVALIAPVPGLRMSCLRRRVRLGEVALVELGIDVMALHPDTCCVDGVAVRRKPAVRLSDVPADRAHDFDHL